MFNKTLVLLFLLTVSSLHAGSSALYAQKQAKDLHYNTTIRAFMKDNTTITELVNKAYAYVVFPDVGKGGALLGGAYGQGRAYRYGRWIGDVTLTQFTIGVQVGGQAYSEIIFFKTKRAFEQFKKGGFEESTQSSLVPFYSGFSGDVNFDKEVSVYTSAKGGLMLEASTGTQHFSYSSRE